MVDEIFGQFMHQQSMLSIEVFCRWHGFLAVWSGLFVVSMFLL